MRLVAATLITALTFVTASAARPLTSAATGGDARCLVAMVALLSSTSPSDQAYGQAGTVYFTGRIAARDPGFDFGLLRTMAASMDAKTAHADLQQNCSPMFQKSMAQLTDVLAGSPLMSPR
jgi:hypothetical protein